MAGEQPEGLTDSEVAAKLASRWTQPEPEQAAPEPQDEPVEAANESDGAPAQEYADEQQDEPVEAAAEPVEPEIEIEWNGEKRRLRGDELKSIAQKGFDAETKWTEAARAREWVQHQTQQLQAAAQFQQQFMGDLVEMKSIESQLAQYDQLNWMQLFDSDPVTALKYKETRDMLREKRSAKYEELKAKHQQAVEAQAQAGRAALDAEERALLAKVPQWRNSEKAAQEKSALKAYVAESLGYLPAEIDRMNDHRMLVGFRKAMLYDQLQKAGAEKAKLVRQAPPMAKPGGANSMQTQSRVKAQEVEQRFRRTGDLKDAAAVLLNRMQRHR